MAASGCSSMCYGDWGGGWQERGEERSLRFCGCVKLISGTSVVHAPWLQDAERQLWAPSTLPLTRQGNLHKQTMRQVQHQHQPQHRNQHQRVQRRCFWPRPLSLMPSNAKAEAAAVSSSTAQWCQRCIFLVEPSLVFSASEDIEKCKQRYIIRCYSDSIPILHIYYIYIKIILNIKFKFGQKFAILYIYIF